MHADTCIGGISIRGRYNDGRFLGLAQGVAAVEPTLLEARWAFSSGMSGWGSEDRPLARGHPAGIKNIWQWT